SDRRRKRSENTCQVKGTKGPESSRTIHRCLPLLGGTEEEKTWRSHNESETPAFDVWICSHRSTCCPDQCRMGRLPGKAGALSRTLPTRGNDRHSCPSHSGPTLQRFRPDLCHREQGW